MSALANMYSVVHSASTANLDNFAYYEVYSGAGGGSATINGTTITFSEGSNMEVLIRTLSGVSGNLYLLGVPVNVVLGSNVIGGTY
jgi:hypothetical protein